jgi:predicted nucleotidyltransferase
VSFEDDLAEHLAARYAAVVVILYGSVAKGDVNASSDVDAACFVADDRRYPESYVHRGRLMDVWIYPLGDAADTESFLKLAGGRVLLDGDGVGPDLMRRVNAYLETPRNDRSKELDESSRAGNVEIARTRPSLRRFCYGDRASCPRDSWPSQGVGSEIVACP